MNGRSTYKISVENKKGKQTKIENIGHHLFFNPYWCRFFFLPNHTKQVKVYNIKS